MLAARNRRGVLLRNEVLELGYSQTSITRRIEDGFLVPVYPRCGAYVLGSTVIERVHRVVAAVALTPRAVADGPDAAALLGLLPNATTSEDRFRERHEPVRIALPHAERIRLDGVKVRRQLHRTDLDVTRRFGVDVLSPERLVLDMAGRWPTSRVAHILDAGMAARTLDLDILLRRHLQLQRRGRKGGPHCRRFARTSTRRHATACHKDGA